MPHPPRKKKSLTPPLAAQNGFKTGNQGVGSFYTDVIIILQHLRVRPFHNIFDWSGSKKGVRIRYNASPNVAGNAMCRHVLCLDV